MEITTHDLVWTGVVFRWGFIGLVLFVLLYLVSIFKAFSLFIKRDDILSKLALLFLLVIVSQFIESFISSTFLSSDRYAMGLWYIAILSSLLLADKNYSDSTTKEQNHE
jgi:O-antigen ligase